MLMLAASLPTPASGQFHIGPPFAEVQATWTALWQRLGQGDVEGARRYVHSARQAVFPWRKTPAELRDLARQMRACRLDPRPLPIDLDEVMYRVVCEHAGERAETLIGLRRDVDGVWRFVTL
jgi:hypothetical protein